MLGGNPRLSGRLLTILFSHEDWVLVHIRVNLAGDRTRKASGVTATPPKPVQYITIACSKLN